MRRYIKSWLVAFIFGLTLPLASAQLITTGGTVTDSDSQTWNNGTWSATPVQTISSGPLYYNGTPISMATVSGVLDGTGTFSTSALYNTSSLTPAGAEYRFIICPNATSTCATIVTPVITSDLSSILSAQVQAPRFLASATARGYLDLEVLNKYIQGATYYNVTMLSSRTWNGTAWVDSGGSGSGTVQAAPQFRHYIQPNAGTVAVAGPSTTSVNAVDPIAQGVGNTDLFATGGGNNGITNFQTMYPSGLATVPPTSTDTEAGTLPPSGSMLIDYRGNAFTRNYHNTQGFNSCNAYETSLYYSECINTQFDAMQNNNYQTARTYRYVGPGTALGFPGAASAEGYTFGAMHEFYQLKASRSISQMFSANFDSDAVGDTAMFEMYLHPDGGAEFAADEGTTGFYMSNIENPGYLHATIATGGTTGTNLLTYNVVSGSIHVTDGGYLLDITSGGTSLGTIASYTTTSLVGSGTNFGTIAETGVSIPASTAWGVLSTNTDSSATGQYQIAVPQTIVVNLGVSPNSGAFAVGDACMVGIFAEHVQITAVGAVSGSTQSVTFSTRYGWNSGSTAIMQGGICGKYVTITGASWRTAVMAVGSINTAQYIYGACSHGSCIDNTLGPVIYPVGSAITAYNGAEIIGTQNGTPDTAQLGYNTVAWSNGDTIEGPHPAAVNLNGIYVNMGQTTVVNGNSTTEENLNWNGPATLSAFSNLTFSAPVQNIVDVGAQTSGSYNNYVVASKLPTQAVFGMQGAVNDGSVRLFDLPQSFITYAGNGSGELVFGSQHGGGFNFIYANNVPPVPTVLAQFPIATDIGAWDLHYSNVVMSGDASMDDTGKVTTAGVTVSGTTCTITAITDGLITAATCTP